MIGKTLSHYNILEEIGRGGMGIVYKAEDTKLDRTVAVKVLPAAALASEDDRARFYREARAAAAISHPNVCHIYEVDEATLDGSEEVRPFIAMECIEGETLRHRIEEGPLKLKDAVSIASQIGEGLEAAHESGIVHRDVKSANVMITPKGQPKILDFGLAKTAQSTMLTRMGSTLGTVAYMSPEQARGEDVDRRTDIWALGTVLYEMVAGRHPFPGDYEQAVVYSILNESPEPLTSLRTGVPMGLEWIVSKCLAKDANDRYQRVEDLLVDLRTVDLSSTGSMTRVSSASSTAHVLPGVTASSHRAWYRQPVVFVSVGAAFLAGALLMTSVGSTSESRTLQPVKRFTMSVPDFLVGWLPAISSDGSKVAYVGVGQDENSGMYIHDLTNSSTEYLPGTEFSAGFASFSEDGRQIFFGGGLGITRSAVDQAVPIRVSDIQTDGRVHWLDSETLMILSGGQPYTLSLASGDTTAYFGSPLLAAIDINPEGVLGYMAPYPIPEHKAAVATALYTDPSRRPDIVFLKDGEANVIVQNAAWPIYSRDGFLTWTAVDGADITRGRFLSQLLDPSTGDVSGVPVAVVTDTDLVFYRHTTGDEGTIWITGMGAELSLDWDLGWIDVDSDEYIEIAAENVFIAPALSPDESTIVFQRWDVAANRHDLYLLDVAAGTLQRFVINGEEPAWSSDGESVFFKRGVGQGFWEARLDRSVPERQVVSDAEDSPGISPDGRFMSFSRIVEGEIHAFVLDLESGEELLIDESSSHVRNARFSPDGRHLVAQREQDGEFKIVVYGYPSGGTFPVTTELGTNPVWSPDGNWIYYLSDNVLRRVAVSASTVFSVRGAPESVGVPGEIYSVFDVAPDGRVLAVRINDVEYPDENVRVIQNWGDELRRQLAEGSN